MKKRKIKVEFGPYQELVDYETGKFKMEEAMRMSGWYAGICYDKKGLVSLLNEPEEKTMKRANMTKENAHHSVFDHANISLNIRYLPKILAMVLNNEHQYNTSEKSGRYTPIVDDGSSIITPDEVRLYNKWMEIFQERIDAEYGEKLVAIHGEKRAKSKIVKLAQENARYLVSVFVPMEMVYTVPLAQLNRIASWMQKYIKVANQDDYFERNLALSMQELLDEFERMNLLDADLMNNIKGRELSLFGENLDLVEEHFGDVYSTVYKASFSEYAQAQRHRTIYYQLELLPEKEYFIPPIILDDENLVREWLQDMEIVKNLCPQGELVRVSEKGTYDNFILKCEERLCTEAQLEIMQVTRDTLLKYQEELDNRNHRYASDIKKYTRGARCTFPKFNCPSQCKFKEGIDLSRKI